MVTSLIQTDKEGLETGDPKIRFHNTKHDQCLNDTSTYSSPPLSESFSGEHLNTSAPARSYVHNTHWTAILENVSILAKADDFDEG